MENPEITGMTQVLVFDAPCCASIRECNVRRHVVVSTDGRLLRVIEAVRCHRGYTKKYKFYPANNVVLASVYVSNRGNWYIKILWKPEGIPESEAILAVKKGCRHLRGG